MRLRQSCCLVLFLACLAPDARAGEMVMVTGEDAVQWRAAPPSLLKGSEISIIAGDPDKPGPFTLRLRFPPNYVIAPHTHATDESVTLLSGTLVHDMGKTIDASRGQSFRQGAFLYLPAKMPHALWTTRDPAVIQVSGTGPFGLDYVNASDDPRKTRSDK
ncbi:cupin domain-containing protein [Methylobacterium sp. A52T]